MKVLWWVLAIGGAVFLGACTAFGVPAWAAYALLPAWLFCAIKAAATLPIR